MTTTRNDDKDNDEVNYENNNEDNYERVNRFLNDIQQKSVGSQTRTKECIKALDTATNKTYDGGAEFLLKWYDSILLQRTSPNSQVQYCKLILCYSISKLTLAFQQVRAHFA